jgi:hypothetical protein
MRPRQGEKNHASLCGSAPDVVEVSDPDLAATSIVVNKCLDLTDHFLYTLRQSLSVEVFHYSIVTG